MPRVAVIGAGAIGTCFAAHLAGTSHDVVACVRRTFDEYVVDSATTPARRPAVVATDPGELDGPFDWVLVAVKTYQTVGATPWFDVTCGPETVVVVLQNGVDGVERLRPLVHGATVVPGVVHVGAELLAPGHVLHTTRNLLVVPDSPEGEALRDLYAGTPVEVDVDVDHRTRAWLKLSTNVVANGLTALTRRPLRVLLEPALLPAATAMVAETWKVANAEGAAIDTAAPEAYVRAIAERNPAVRTSMQMDVEAGRPTEHDAIHGAVLRAAARHDIATPTVMVVYGILDALEGRVRQSV